jgi:quinol-cytochrome oxidoreductase complex cytochrome b subunit
MSVSPTTLTQQALGLVNKAQSYVSERLARVDFFDETKADLQKESPWYQLGAVAYLFWITVVITGIVLVMAYIPTTSQAYDSIIAIKDNVIFGIIRGCHKYGGDALIIAATLRVYRMWINAEYKNRGEFAFILAIVILLAGMYSGLSGYLLIWNQRAFWATKIFATFPTYLDAKPAVEFWFIPKITSFMTATIGDLTYQGRNTSQILLGGTSISQATMTRFFSLHFAISLIALVVTELYFYKARLKRLNLGPWQIVLLLSMLVFTAIILPAEMGSRANPEVTPLPILSDWYFLALYQMLKYMDPYWATIWTVAIPAAVIGLIFLDWGPEKNFWRRPIFAMAMFSGLLGFIVFSVLIIMNIADINNDPPWWYAQIAVFFTIGEIWHFALYRNMMTWLVWVVPNVALAFTAYFIYVIPKPVLSGPLKWLWDLPEGFKLNPYHKMWLDLYIVYALLLIAFTAFFWMLNKKSSQQALQQASPAAETGGA